MATVHVLDDYYLAITLLVTVAYQLFFFSIAYSLKFDKLTDLAGGSNFVVLAILTLSFSDGPDARQIICSLLLMIWASRLSGFLLFRIVKTGTDTRFDDKRDRFLPFLGFWVAQMAWVWIVSLPVTILNSPEVNRDRSSRPASFGTGLDIASLILWTLGFVVESVSDVQKYRFKSSATAAARSKDNNNNTTTTTTTTTTTSGNNTSSTVCDVGFFNWSRHPNYFGEIVLHFAIYMMSVSASVQEEDGGRPRSIYAAQVSTIVAPIFLTSLLLFVSGLPLQERPGAKKRYEASGGPDGQGWIRYRTYLSRTSILIPFPPRIYVRLPVWVKRSVLLEFPIYVFDPDRHADQAKVRDREQRRVEEGG